MYKSIDLYNQLASNKKFKKSVNFGLKRIKLALTLLGHPEKKLKNVISVIGESGKFTTLTSLKSFIEANNHKVTTHISPSLQDIRERFYMSNKYLTHNEIKKTYGILFSIACCAPAMKASPDAAPNEPPMNLKS